MATVTILDEFEDGKGTNYEVVIELPSDLQSFFQGVTSYTLKASAQYSSITLTDAEKQAEVQAAASAKITEHIESTRKKFRLHGTTLEV